MSEEKRPENAIQKLHQLVVRWEKAKEEIEGIKSRLNGAECEFMNAQNELGAFLTPEDAKTDESFHVWYGDGMIQASIDTHNNYRVSWRKRPSKLE